MHDYKLLASYIATGIMTIHSYSCMRARIAKVLPLIYIVRNMGFAEEGDPGIIHDTK